MVSNQCYLSPKDDTAVQFEAPLEVRARQPGERVVLFDADAYIVPADIDDSVVEVWFRRLFHAPQFSGQWGEPYPLYLVERDYGWQGYGLER